MNMSSMRYKEMRKWLSLRTNAFELFVAYDVYIHQQTHSYLAEATVCQLLNAKLLPEPEGIALI